MAKQSIRGRETERTRSKDLAALQERSRIIERSRKKDRSNAYEEIDLESVPVLFHGSISAPESHDDQIAYDYDLMLESISPATQLCQIDLYDNEETDSSASLVDSNLLNTDVHFEITLSSNSQVVIECLCLPSCPSVKAALEEMEQFLLMTLQSLNPQVAELSIVDLILEIFKCKVAKTTTIISGGAKNAPRARLSDRVNQLYSRKFARLPGGQAFSLGLLIANSKAESLSLFPDAILLMALNLVFEKEFARGSAYSNDQFRQELVESLAELVSQDHLGLSLEITELLNLQNRLNGRSTNGKPAPRNLFPLKSERTRRINAVPESRGTLEG
jgi:hypothetical protein